MDTPKKRKNTTKAERFERFSHRLCRKRHKKRDNACSEKSKTKNFSRFFSPERSGVLSSVAFGRYESYLINLFLLQEERAFATREEERRESFAHTINHRVVVEIVFLVFVESFKSESKKSTFGFAFFRRRLKKK